MPRSPTTTIERVSIPPTDGDRVDFGGLGVVWKIESDESAGRFSVVEHPITPRALAAPLHRHRNEDEYSFVLEGTLGALLGERVIEAGPGSWVFKPRGEWHTFWNAGDTGVPDHRGDLARRVRELLPRAGRRVPRRRCRRRGPRPAGRARRALRARARRRQRPHALPPIRAQPPDRVGNGKRSTSRAPPRDPRGCHSPAVRKKDRGISGACPAGRPRPSAVGRSRPGGAHPEVAQQAVLEPVDDAVHRQGLSARPRVLDDRGLTDVTTCSATLSSHRRSSRRSSGSDASASACFSATSVT